MVKILYMYVCVYHKHVADIKSLPQTQVHKKNVTFFSFLTVIELNFCLSPYSLCWVIENNVQSIQGLFSFLWGYM